MRVIFRGRCTIWWKQAAKTVKIVSSKHCLSLPQSAKLRKPQSTLSLSQSAKVWKPSKCCLSLSLSLSLSLKVQNCGNLKVPSLSLRVQKCENPQSVVSLSLSKCKTVETSKFSFSFKYEIWSEYVNLKCEYEVKYVNMTCEFECLCEWLVNMMR